MSGSMTVAWEPGKGPGVYEHMSRSPALTGVQHLFADLQRGNAICAISLTLEGPACRGLGHLPTPEPEGLAPSSKFNPLLFQMEQLRPREVKQFAAGHTELVTDNGRKLTALPGFLLLFSSISSLLPSLPHSSN